MKRILLCVLVLLLAAGVLVIEMQKRGTETEDSPAPQTENTQPAVPLSGEIRAVWVNYNEISMQRQSGGTKAQFTEKAKKIANDIAAAGLNTVIFHVRPFCDALYPSELFPWSAYLTGTQGQAVDYDPLQIFLDCAKAAGLSVQAWINPYRVLLSRDESKLAVNNPARQYLDAGKSENLLLTENGIYLNPASSEAQALIINGVREIIKNYDVDAIHMDDYFYPTTDPAVDSVQYSAYQAAGGTLSLGDWRRENVSVFVSGLYAAIKAINPEVQLVISPGGNIQHNYNNLYADVARWAREPGFCDVLMPQLYYGFLNENLPFEATAREWVSLVTAPNVKLCFGLAFYKSGKEDQYAESGSREWMEYSDIIARQIAFCRTLSPYHGFALYTYSSVFSDSRAAQPQKEWENLQNLLAE